MQLDIRKPFPEEFETISQLINYAFSVEPLHLASDFFKDQKINCFVAVANDEILGTASLHIIQKNNRKMGLIEDVVVAPNSKGKGIGKKLIHELIQSAEKIGC